MILNKRLARAGVASRRKVIELITAGRVTVNGRIVAHPAYDTQDSDIIAVDNIPLVESSKRYYILLNKPNNYVTTVQDERGRKTVLSLIDLPEEARIYPVGRLDRATTGLLLLTNDGDLAYALSHPKFEVTKEYVARLDRNFPARDLNQLIDGVTLEDGVVAADEASYYENARNTVRIVLHSGKNRVVRRMFEALGYKVVQLDRTKYAGLTKKKLLCGHWRHLTPEEVSHLRALSKPLQKSARSKKA